MGGGGGPGKGLRGIGELGLIRASGENALFMNRTSHQ